MPHRALVEACMVDVGLAGDAGVDDGELERELEG
jgi:hypothetical protein